jgi:hypothetical protein
LASCQVENLRFSWNCHGFADYLNRCPGSRFCIAANGPISSAAISLIRSLPLSGGSLARATKSGIEMKYILYALLACLLTSIPAHAATLITPPFTNDSNSQFDPQIPLTRTIDQQVILVWAAYQKKYPSFFPGCSYTFAPTSPPSPGYMGTLTYQGTCGGSTDILATLKSPKYYARSPRKQSHNGKGCDCETGRTSSADPIEIGTGNNFVSETDFTGADPRLRFARTYNSALTDVSDEGYGWIGTLDTTIAPWYEKMLPPDGTQQTSGGYDDPDSACAKGFLVIAAQDPAMFAGDTALWMPNSQGGGVCDYLNSAGVVQ